MKRIKRRYNYNIVWIASFAGCVVFAVSMLFGIIFVMGESSRTRAELENGYKKSFYEMADNVNNIELNLSKMMVSAEEEQTVEIAEAIRLEALAAQSNLNQLPLSVKTSHDVNRYLNQVGDWCASYNRAMLNNGETSIYEEKLEQLYDVTKSINGEIGKIASNFNNSGYSVSKNLKRNGIKAAGDFSLATDTLNDTSVEYPQLIYDGPFSDSDGKKCFRALDGQNEISLLQAQDNISRIFNDMGLKNVQSIGETTEPSAYEFKGEVNGGEIYLSVSKCGGKLLSANTNILPKGQKIDRIEAQELAVKYAGLCDYCCDLVPVWYNSIGGAAYINLAPKTDGIIYYPDLVKVKVSLEDGGLLAIESMGFCKNNHKRDSQPLINEKEAKSAISPKLNIKSARLVYIPINQTEKLCYEIVCDYRGLDYFVYVDAISGKQANILRVVDEDQGEMTF